MGGGGGGYVSAFRKPLKPSFQSRMVFRGWLLPQKGVHTQTLVGVKDFQPILTQSNFGAITRFSAKDRQCKSCLSSKPGSTALPSVLKTNLTCCMSTFGPNPSHDLVRVLYKLRTFSNMERLATFEA